MSARRLTLAGAAGVAASLVLFAWLHLTPPSSLLDWRTRTISQYALLDNGWAFDAATLLLAAGSTAVLVALVRAGRIRAASWAAVALGCWVAGLAGVVLFDKHDWSVGPSVSGDIHRAASLVAFLSLPAAAVLAGAPWLRRPSGRTAAALVVAAGVVSFLCFSPILWALVAETWTGVRWWRAIPLGGVERLLGLAEVGTVVLMAWWAGAPAGRAGAPGRRAGITRPSERRLTARRPDGTP
jgi:hypothetical protein